MSHEHELIQELRAARRSVREAEIQEQEARVKVAERKAARMKAAAAVEEILAEMDGTSDRPLIDAINRNGESADERQRGPTAEKPKRKRQTERADRRETVISPKGPIRQTEKYIGPGPVKLAEDHLAKLDAEANGEPDFDPRAARRDAILKFIEIYQPETAQQVRVCNKCDRPRVHTVAACVMCRCPEFRSIHQALADLGLPYAELPEKLKPKPQPVPPAAAAAAGKPKARKAAKAGV